MPRTPAPLTVETFVELVKEGTIEVKPDGEVIASGFEIKGCASDLEALVIHRLRLALARYSAADARAFVALPALEQALWKIIALKPTSVECADWANAYQESAHIAIAALAQADGPKEQP
jgi:hypothetical protein